MPNRKSIIPLTHSTIVFCMRSIARNARALFRCGGGGGHCDGGGGGRGKGVEDDLPISNQIDASSICTIFLCLSSPLLMANCLSFFWLPN